MNGRKLERRDEPGNLLDVRLPAELAAPKRVDLGPVVAQARREAVKPARQGGHLGVPIAIVTQRAVHEYHGLALPALDIRYGKTRCGGHKRWRSRAIGRGQNRWTSTCIHHSAPFGDTIDAVLTKENRIILMESIYFSDTTDHDENEGARSGCAVDADRGGGRRHD